MKRVFLLLFGSILLTACGGSSSNTPINTNPTPSINNSGDNNNNGNNSSNNTNEFVEYESNHDSTQINAFISSNGTTTSSYTEINGTYGYYDCKEYTYYGSSSIEYYAEYSLYRVVIRSGSDLAMTSFKFQRFNSTNSGMLMNVNGASFTTTISINSSTHEANSPYSFVNTGLYQLNKFSCQYGGVILTN